MNDEMKIKLECLRIAKGVIPTLDAGNDGIEVIKLAKIMYEWINNS